MSNAIHIFLKNVSVKMSNRDIISKVDLSIKRGEFLYVTGDTGSGKSSLLKTLYAEYPIKSGIGTVLNYNLNEISNNEIPYLRRRIGIVFQDFSLLMDRNAYDNLLFVLKATGWTNKKEIKDLILEKLSEVGIEDCIYKMPYQMSGGEQQRLCISRALLNNPELILADEPTGNLDPETSEAVLDLLLDINRSGKTVVMATHDYSLMEKHNTRIVQFDFGKIISDGNDLIEKENSIENFLD